MSKRDATIERSMNYGHESSYIVNAAIRHNENLGSFWFSVSRDIGDEENFTGNSTCMSSTISKMFDTYDEAVIAMNKVLEGIIKS